MKNNDFTTQFIKHGEKMIKDYKKKFIQSGGKDINSLKMMYNIHCRLKDFKNGVEVSEHPFKIN